MKRVMGGEEHDRALSLCGDRRRMVDSAMKGSVDYRLAGVPLAIA
jgi:hypothetical protein